MTFLGLAKATPAEVDGGFEFKRADGAVGALTDYRPK
jgi:hypothetical protein